MTCGRCNGDGEVTKSDGIRVECIRCSGTGCSTNAVSGHYQHAAAVAHFYGTPSHAMASAIARMGNVLEGGR